MLAFTSISTALVRGPEPPSARSWLAELRPLHGVASAIKDLFDFKPGWPATLGGIRALKHNVVNSYCAFCERMEARGGQYSWARLTAPSWDSAAPVTITCSGLRVTHSILRRTAAAPLSAAQR